MIELREDFTLSTGRAPDSRLRSGLAADRPAPASGGVPEGSGAGEKRTAWIDTGTGRQRAVTSALTGPVRRRRSASREALHGLVRPTF